MSASLVAAVSLLLPGCSVPKADDQHAHQTQYIGVYAVNVLTAAITALQKNLPTPLPQALAATE